MGGRGNGGMVIRDAVHGDIALDEAERMVLDTREVQRLRGIKQLGAAYLVYPGCLHTRFEHSLGTLAMAERILASVARHGWPVSADDKLLVRVAALIHDVSHIPFGHTFEDERKVFPRHDTPERFSAFLAGGELAGTLERLGLLEGVRHVLWEGPPDWRRDIVAGALDADLLDYLRRDAYFAGLSQQYDDRVFQYFTVVDGRLALNLAKRGMDRLDARSEIVHLLRMRYFLTERVYLHHAKVIAGAMISKALELATAYGVRVEHLFGLNDHTLFAFLAHVPAGGPADPAISELVRGVVERKLYKRAYVISGATVARSARDGLILQYHADRARRERAETAIAAAAGVPPHQVILSCPAAGPMREAAVFVLTREGPGYLNRLRGRAGASPPDIGALEEQYEDLWRLQVFCPREVRARVAAAAQEWFGYPNELDGPLA